MFPQPNEIITKYKDILKKALKWIVVFVVFLVLLNLSILTFAIYTSLEVRDLKKDIQNIKQTQNK
jgi:hypothetical protein